MDDPTADLTVPKNKGHEAAAYLSYLIDNHHDLPSYMLFLHPDRYQWHNKDPMYDGLRMLQHFRLAHIDDAGFANVRSTWSIGCPNELSNLTSNPGAYATATPKSRDETERAFLPAFRQLFPDLPEPAEVGIPCDGQFAVSKTQVLKRPKSHYVRYYDWVRDTELDDAISGRVLEYSWHMIFQKPAVYCPTASQCFCERYSLCNLDCAEVGDCGRYRLPVYSSIPDGWPNSGQEGMDGWPERDWWL